MEKKKKKNMEGKLAVRVQLSKITTQQSVSVTALQTSPLFKITAPQYRTREQRWTVTVPTSSTLKASDVHFSA